MLGKLSGSSKMKFLLPLLLCVCLGATPKHKGAATVKIKKQPVSLMPTPPPIIAKSFSTKGATKAAIRYTNPFNITSEIPSSWRTNLYWDPEPGTQFGDGRVEYEIIQTTNWVEWSLLAVTTNMPFNLGAVQTGTRIRFFRVGARWAQ
jgi:hypothetical protein